MIFYNEGLVQKEHTVYSIYSVVPLKRGQFSQIFTNSLPVRSRYGVSFVDPASDWYSASLSDNIEAISYYIGPRYNGTCNMLSICSWFCCALFCCGYFISAQQIDVICLHILQGYFTGTRSVMRITKKKKRQQQNTMKQIVCTILVIYELISMG